MPGPLAPPMTPSEAQRPGGRHRLLASWATTQEQGVTVASHRRIRRSSSVLTLGMAVALPVSLATAMVGPITSRAAAPHRPASFTAIGTTAHLPAGDRILGSLPGGTLVRADVVLQ